SCPTCAGAGLVGVHHVGSGQGGAHPGVEVFQQGVGAAGQAGEPSGGDRRCAVQVGQDLGGALEGKVVGAHQVGAHRADPGTVADGGTGSGGGFGGGDVSAHAGQAVVAVFGDLQVGGWGQVEDLAAAQARMAGPGQGLGAAGAGGGVVVDDLVGVADLGQ